MDTTMVVSKVVYVSITVIIANGMNHHCLGFSVVTHPNPSYLTHKKKQPIRRWSAFDAKLSSSTLRAVSPSLIVPTSLISASNHWGNIAVLSLSASFAQLLGKTTLIGRLLGAPVTAMALAFVLSSLSILPSFTSGLNWLTLLPPGGSQASSFLQIVSLTLATPLLLLGTSIRGRALRRCGSLLGSFVIASLGTLVGAIIAIVLPSTTHIIPPLTLPNGDGVKIATALLAKNIGGGINYMAVCSCLGAAPESIAAGLCVDNVMALAYFPLTSALASKFKDVDDCDNPRQESNLHHDENNIELISPVESLSHAFTIAVVLTASGQCLNNLLQRNSKSLNLSLPITTLLTVVFSTFYPPNWFMSPATSSNERSKNNLGFSNSIAKSGEVLGTSLLYLFFATAGAPGWKLKDSIQQSFPSIASFLIIMYGVHLGMLYCFQQLTNKFLSKRQDYDGDLLSFWEKVAAPQRLLAASSAAIGGPATAAALAQANEWRSLITPSLLVGNVGYAIATFLALAYYSAFR